MCQDGPRDAPALLLIHGTASSTRAWDPMVPLLTGSHRVIRIHLLGHGRSAAATRSRTRHVGPTWHWTGSASSRPWSSPFQRRAAATALAGQRPDLVTALAFVNTGPSLNAFIASESAAIGASQWPPTDEEVRQFASTGFSRAGYQIPRELLDDGAV